MKCFFSRYHLMLGSHCWEHNNNREYQVQAKNNEMSNILRATEIDVKDADKQGSAMRSKTGNEQ